MYPTKLAIIKMAQQFGYSVVILKPGSNTFTGSSRYKHGIHKAFICAKKTCLSSIKAKTESVTWGSRFRDFSIWTFRFILYNRFSYWLEKKLPKRWTSLLRQALG
jgi:hypothetical protein